MVSSLPPSRCPDCASFTHPSVLGTGNCSVPPFPWGLPERLEYFLFWLVWTGTWHSCDPKDSIWVLLVTWKAGVPFGGDIVGFTWLSCWNIQPPKHWPRSSLPPMFWFSVITKALWFQSPLILSVLFTLWGSLKTSRFCPNTRSRISWDANPCVPHGGGGSWNGSSSHGSLGLLCLALSQNARIFCDRVYPKEGECDNLKYFWKKHEILSSPQEILLSTGEGSLFPGS